MHLFHLKKAVFILILLALSFSGCKKKGCTNPYAKNYDAKAVKDDCSCVAYVDEMEGTYEMTVTSYPWDDLQEGNTYDVLVFRDHENCSDAYPDSDFNRIRFNNLFDDFECTYFDLEDFSFELTLSDHKNWALAPLVGHGHIKYGLIHFEGTVYTSGGEYPIVLDGVKISNSRRTDAC